MTAKIDAYPSAELNDILHPSGPLTSWRLGALHTSAIGLDAVTTALAHHLEHHDGGDQDDYHVHGLICAARALAMFSRDIHSTLYERLADEAIGATERTGTPHRWQMTVAPYREAGE